MAAPPLLLTPFILASKDGADFESNPESDQNPEQSQNKQRYLEILKCVEDLIKDDIHWNSKGQPHQSRLKRLVPSIGTFYTNLPLCLAFEKLEKTLSITTRRFVPPSFNDIRRLLNNAQILAIAPLLQLITFDADMTLYSDGGNFTRENVLLQFFIRLIKIGLKVAVVTAAGYPTFERYQERFQGLLAVFAELRAQDDTFNISNFYIMGGECNYLFQCGNDGILKFLQPDDYQSPEMKLWCRDEARIKAFLDISQSHLTTRVSELHLSSKTSIIRKERAVGVNPHPGSDLTREQLDELALSVRQKLETVALSDAVQGKTMIPFCAFNGGRDVWVDCGNKSIGVSCLASYFKVAPKETLHVGDQFLGTGNDRLTRSAACTVWITGPEETKDVLTQLVWLLEGN